MRLRHPPRDVLSPRGRRALELARSEAACSGKRSVAPEHLLLGCLRTVEGAPAEMIERAGLSLDALRADLVNGTAAPRLDAEALATIGIDLEEVRSRIEERFGEGALERTSLGTCRVALSVSTKRALGAASRDARERGDVAGPEHLLLVLIERRAASILREHGVTPARLRGAVLEELGEG
jgi:ATP-dependent Clp protease ATP-binding subunit ClpA